MPSPTVPEGAPPPSGDVIEIPTRDGMRVRLMDRVGGVAAWARREGLALSTVQAVLTEWGGRTIDPGRVRSAKRLRVARAMAALADSNRALGAAAGELLGLAANRSDSGHEKKVIGFAPGASAPDPAARTAAGGVSDE